MVHRKFENLIKVQRKNNPEIIHFLHYLLAPTLSNFRVLSFDNCFVWSLFSYIFHSSFLGISMLLLLIIRFLVLSYPYSEILRMTVFLLAIYLLNLYLLTPAVCETLHGNIWINGQSSYPYGTYQLRIKCLNMGCQPTRSGAMRNSLPCLCNPAWDFFSSASTIDIGWTLNVMYK